MTCDFVRSCDEELKGSLVAQAFSQARTVASITRLVRHCFLRTQEEFQYSKNIEFSLILL